MHGVVVGGGGGGGLNFNFEVTLPLDFFLPFLTSPNFVEGGGGGGAVF